MTSRSIVTLVQNVSQTTDFRNCLICGKELQFFVGTQTETISVLCQMLEIQLDKMPKTAKFCLVCNKSLLYYDNLCKRALHLRKEISDKLKNTLEAITLNNSEETTINVLEFEREECKENYAHDNQSIEAETEAILYDAERDEFFTLDTLTDELSFAKILGNTAKDGSFAIFEDFEENSFVSINTLFCEYDEEVEKLITRLKRLPSKDKKLVAQNSLPELDCAEAEETYASRTSSNKVKEENYLCSYCERPQVFSRNEFQKFANHVLTVHKKWLCPFCLTVFSTLKDLHLHIRTSHEWKNDSNFKCEHCKRLFKIYHHFLEHNCSKKRKVCKNRNLKKAQDLDHATNHFCYQKTHQCDVCNKIFLSEKSFYEHKTSHYNLTTFKCKYCHKDFSQYSHLVLHHRTNECLGMKILS